MREMMRAVVCHGFDRPEQTTVDVVPVPPMIDGGIRIEVRSSGVSFANLLVLKGKHQNRAEPPFTPGTEVAGTVVEVADGVTRFALGDRVVAGLQTGGFARQVVVPARTVFALPDGVDFDSAVHFSTIYATAYASLVWRAPVQRGETLLVHGAAGASGLAAVEIGKALGARVIATAGSEEKLAVARAHGADLAINYRDGGFREQVLEATRGCGADVIFDPVGGATFDESLRCVAPDGRLIPMGFASGEIPSIPANILLVKNVTVVGLYWGYYMGWARVLPPAGVEDDVRRAFEQMFTWFGEGKLRPVTDSTFGLDDFAAALERVSARKVIGKVVLRPQD